MFRFMRSKRALTSEACNSLFPSEKFRLSDEGRAILHDDGIVFLQVRSGTVFKSNRIGAEIWKRLADGENVDSIAANLSRQYTVSCERALADARNFVSELESRSLVTRRGDN
jgi:hypothetical protein